MPDTATIERSAGSAGEAPVRLGGLDHVVLRVGEQPRLVQLRAGASLIDLVPAGVSPQGAADQAGRNMDHFCVRVLGFDAAALKAHLEKNGVDPGEVHERYGAEGYGPSIYIRDPDGNTVELKGEATRGL
jgi:catechol 2,3-dioxygenase-like lactoylglutathione lyase family enzyme